MLGALPVGLWTGALLLDLISLGAAEGAVFVRLSFYAIAVGLAVALVSVPPGLAGPAS